MLPGTGRQYFSVALPAFTVQESEERRNYSMGNREDKTPAVARDANLSAWRQANVDETEWWRDAYAALWTAAAIGGAFGSAYGTAGLDKNIFQRQNLTDWRSKNLANDNAVQASSSASSLFLVPANNNSQVELDGSVIRQAFECTIPASLVDGQKIRIGVGATEFETTIATAAQVSYPWSNGCIPSAGQEKSAPDNDARTSSTPRNEILLEKWLRKHKQHDDADEQLLINHRKDVQLTTDRKPTSASTVYSFPQFRRWSSSASSVDSPNNNVFTERIFVDTSSNEAFRKSLKSNRSYRANERQSSEEQTIVNLLNRSGDTDTEAETKLVMEIPPEKEEKREKTNSESDDSQGNISSLPSDAANGVYLEEIKRFAKAFKMKRLSLGLTQTQVGQTLSLNDGPAYSQSAICRFEKLDITPKSAQKIKPVLERWMHEIDMQIGHISGASSQHATTSSSVSAENAPCYSPGQKIFSTTPTTDVSPIGDTGTEVYSPANEQQSGSKRRKRRTSFTPYALESLNEYFERNTHPSGLEMTALAENLNYDREVVRVWFCNKRQALKNCFKKLKTSHHHQRFFQ